MITQLVIMRIYQLWILNKKKKFQRNLNNDDMCTLQWYAESYR